jgi:hypothetical protein
MRRLDQWPRIAQCGIIVNNVRFIIQISKGLIRAPRARRMLMFYSVLALLLLIFAGATFLWSMLREHPLLFIGYWGACAWITLLSVLLAFYDLASVRLEAKRERERLAEEHFGGQKDNSSNDPHAR